MHDKLYANQQALSRDDLIRYANDLHLFMPAFQSCLDDGKYAGMINQDKDAGTAAGVRGTPSFFVGRLDPSGKVNSPVMLGGAKPYEQFKAVLDSLLASP